MHGDKPSTRRTDWGTFTVLQNGLVVASGSGPFEDAMREAKHYVAIYGQDGPVKAIVRRTKRKEAGRAGR